MSLTPDFCFRLVLWSGLDAGSVVLFDSGRGVPIPFEGVISEGPAIRIQFITDKLNNQNIAFNIHYEGELPLNMHIKYQLVFSPGSWITKSYKVCFYLER